MNERKAHTIGWKTLCSSKNMGGMGFTRMSSLNEACLSKMGWNLLNDEWSHVVKAKYGRDGRGVSELIVKGTYSKFWHNLGSIWGFLQNHCEWTLHNGRKIGGSQTKGL